MAKIIISERRVRIGFVTKTVAGDSQQDLWEDLQGPLATLAKLFSIARRQPEFIAVLRLYLEEALWPVENGLRALEERVAKGENAFSLAMGIALSHDAEANDGLVNASDPFEDFVDKLEL
jgi:hypothetical protein